MLGIKTDEGVQAILKSGIETGEGVKAILKLAKVCTTRSKWAFEDS